MRALRWAASLGIAVFLAGCTVRVSVDAAGGDPDSSSSQPSVSTDGRFVAFTSRASDLVAGDSNGAHDVYRRDLEDNKTARVSVDKDGGDPNFDSFDPSITYNGNRVAFVSSASDLVDDDANGRQDVFVRDLEGRLTTRISVDAAGGDPNDQSQSPDISGDGRYVAFSSFASDLVPNDGNGTVDVFVRDLLTSTTTRVSVDRKGNDANGSSGDPSVSADGRYVAFQSYASDLIVGDRNGTADIFVRDLVEGTTRRVSVDTAGGDANNFSSSPDISADGNHIAFTSIASDLVADDRNVCFSEFGPVSCADVFLRDVAQGTTLRVSVDAGGGDANDVSASPSINGDGLRIAFASDASDIVTDDRNAVSDIFVREVGALRDAVGYATRRVSVDTHGRDADLFSFAPAISADGRAVAFESFATDLVAGDANGTVDVFLRPIPQAPH